MIVSCCFTGHRRVPEEEKLALLIELDETLRSLIAKGVSEFYCGGARGFDTLAGESVLSLKKTYPFLKLHLLLPCKDQARFWSPDEQQAYARLLAAADSVHCLFEEYDKNCMRARNQALVEAAHICVCYLKKESGGTAFTVALAAKKKRILVPLGLNEAETARFEERFLSPQLDLESFLLSRER